MVISSVDFHSRILGSKVVTVLANALIGAAIGNENLKENKIS